MEWTNIILSSLGSIASILGLVFAISKERKLRNVILYGVILILSISTGVLSYQYSKATNERLNIELRKEALKFDAKKLLDGAPSYISYYEPGENEGLIYGILILLESNKDIYPETYDTYKRTVIERIEKADSLDIYQRREIMENSGNTALQFLRSLSNER